MKMALAESKHASSQGTKTPPSKGEEEEKTSLMTSSSGSAHAFPPNPIWKANSTSSQNPDEEEQKHTSKMMGSTEESTELQSTKKSAVFSQLIKRHS